MTAVLIRFALRRSSAAQRTYQGDLAVVTHACRKHTQVFRFNNRKELDAAGRFSLAVSQMVGRRLTFAELTGKTGTTTVN
jgi:hypothetical protein